MYMKYLVLSDVLKQKAAGYCQQQRVEEDEVENITVSHG